MNGFAENEKIKVVGDKIALADNLNRGKVVELLSPAGDWDCAKAAVENGADAIYFGLEYHNARLRAENFTLEALPELMEYLHLRGVKGYITLNTLIFTDELFPVEETIRKIIRAGADAVIVQDIGLCRLIRKISPDFPVHASTQMTITNSTGIKVARELGCNRVILARECSMEEIKRICAATGADGLPVEVFVHGALCVAYSGQCLTSESLGGRSANRGECAQACRMPYELVCDGKRLELKDQKYLLSPKDLVALELLPDLIELGVRAFKIEGRLKSPEYVANITRVYRNAIDAILTGKPYPLRHPGSYFLNQDISKNPWYSMEMAFSRGLYTGWLNGLNNRELVHARFGKKRGVYLGMVTRVSNGTVYLRLEAPIKPGDGVVFDAGRPNEDEEGGRIYEVKLSNGRKITTEKELSEGLEVGITFGRGDVNFSRIKPGNLVWKTSDPSLERELKLSYSCGKPMYKKPISITVYGNAGEPMYLEVRDELGNVVSESSEVPLQEAKNQPLTFDILAEQLGRLGNTQFRLAGLEYNLQGSVILPLSELNRLRRVVVEQLEKIRKKPPSWVVNDKVSINTLMPAPERNNHSVKKPCLRVLVRSLRQLEAALKFPIERLYCDFEDINQYRQAVHIVNNHHKNNFINAGDKTKTGIKPEIFVAPPRIHKDGEEYILNNIHNSGADGFLVRNFAHLEYFKGLKCVADYTFNIANPISAGFLMERWKPQAITVSYDLNAEQIFDLLEHAPTEWFEITIHQHMPMFHMEYCLFCRFLSSGKDFRDCGRPCDKHTLKLRDRVGAEHAVKADAACRNTVFNALAQTGAKIVPKLIELGARNFRIEFVDEKPDVVSDTITRYLELLAGKISGAELWRKLKLVNQIGVTRGQLLEPTNKGVSIQKGYKAVAWG